MKEATGELSMTVVVIVAVIGLVLIVNWLFVGDNAVAKGWIEKQWGRISNEDDQVPDIN